MTPGRSGRLFGSLAISVMVASGATVGLDAIDPVVSSSVGPGGYRGVVSADFDAATAAEEIVGDFGSFGVWIHHAGTWTQLTTANPAWVFAVRSGGADYELIGDFETLGLWMWDYTGYPGTWTRITAADAEAGLAVDDDGDGNEEIQVSFAAAGMWRYDFDTSTFTKITDSQPVGTGLRTDLWTLGRGEGTWSFGSQGLWAVYWDSNTAVWNRLAASEPTRKWAAANFSGAGTSSGELVAEFTGSAGTWVYGGNSSDTGSWTQIAVAADRPVAMVPARLGTDAQPGLIYAKVDRQGPWHWLKSAWTLFGGGVPVVDGFGAPFDADALVEAFAEEEVPVNYSHPTLGGLWLYNYTPNGTYSGRWTKLTELRAEFMVSSDYYGDGRRTALIASFGPGVGLWIYDSGGGSHAATWYQLSSAVPDYTDEW